MDKDYIPYVIDGEETYLMSARGVLKFVIGEFVRNPFEGKKIIKASKWLFAKISENGYGLSQMQIFSKVKLMSGHEAVLWAESIYGKYLSQDEVMDMFKNI